MSPGYGKRGMILYNEGEREGAAMENKRKILVADDDPGIREILRLLLKGEGFDVAEASDGQEAVALADSTVDLYILDVMMPGQSGFSACEKIRAKTAAPILFLTARTQDSDKTMGFGVGADDYLQKPFSYAELLARVKAMLRRYYVYGGQAEDGAAGGTIRLGDIAVDPARGTVERAGEEIMLTEIETGILLLLAGNRKKIFSVQNIYESVWREPYFYTSNNTVMVHIRNLRKKLGDEKGELIRTVWGKGYRVE